MLKFLGYAALAFVAYFVVRFLFLGQPLVLPASSDKPLLATVSAVNPNKEIVVALHNSEGEARITEITVARSLASQLGLSPPTGFKEEKLTLSEEEKADKEEVASVDKYNEETLRWVGTLPLTSKTTTPVAFPAHSTDNLTGAIRFQVEAKWGMGGSISSVSAKLATPEAQQGVPADRPRPAGSAGG